MSKRWCFICMEQGTSVKVQSIFGNTVWVLSFIHQSQGILRLFNKKGGPIIEQSHDFWSAYSLFVVRVASFTPKQSDGANDATRDTNGLYALQKSCDYYYQYPRQNRTIHLVSTVSVFSHYHPSQGGKYHLQPHHPSQAAKYHLQSALCFLACEKERFREGSLSFGLA